MKLSKNTEVKITSSSENELIGQYGRIYKIEGEESSTGDKIPEGWVEVIFSPFKRELFRVSDLKISEFE